MELTRHMWIKDPFCGNPSLRYRRAGKLHQLREFLGSFSRARRVSIYNTVEHDLPLQLALDDPNLKFVVVHHGKMVDQPQYQRLLENNRLVRVVALARHAGAYLEEKGFEPVVLNPVYFGPVADPPLLDKVRFCVQGNVEKHRRDYDSLWKALSDIQGTPGRSFEVDVVGRYSPAAMMVKAEAIASGLSEIVSFRDGCVKFRDFFSQLRRSHFLLPLIAEGDPRFHAYYTSAATTSLMMAIGLGIVPILDAGLARIYGIENIGIVYGPNGLRDALERARCMDVHELSERRVALLKHRAALLEANAKGLSKALVSLS